MTEDTLLWLLGAAWSTIMFLAGGFVGDLKGSLSVRAVSRALAEHAALDAHPVSLQRHDEAERRYAATQRTLERIEEKIDRGRGAL